MKWTLHDASGPIRSGIDEDEVRELIRSNADPEQHNGEAINTWASSEDGQLRIAVADGPTEPAVAPGEVR